MSFSVASIPRCGLCGETLLVNGDGRVLHNNQEVHEECYAKVEREAVADAGDGRVGTEARPADAIAGEPREGAEGALRDAGAVSGAGKSSNAKRLATLALAVLDAQQKYFKSRSRDDLIASKRLEKELREKATVALRIATPADSDAEIARHLLSTPTGCCTSTAYALFAKYRRPFDATIGATDTEIIDNLRWLADLGGLPP